MPFRLSKSNSLYSSFRAITVDTSAQAFIDAAALTDAAQKNAINKLTLDLKVYGLWGKMKAIYPMIGGTATTHKWNLVNPQDTNGAYRLTFSGGWTHSATGAKPDGLNGYANTFFIPTSNLTNNSTHYSYYSRSNTVGTMIDMGCNGSTPDQWNLLLRYTGGGFEGLFSDQYNFNTNRINVTTNLNSSGFYITTRTSSVVHKVYKSGIQIGNTDTNASTGFASQAVSIIIGNRADLPAGLYSNRECAFASIGDGLTDIDSFNLNVIVQNYQTNLGRQV
jgi:hypothetical protein